MPSSEESPESFVSGHRIIDGEVMLFGVRLNDDPMRKSVSLNNLSEYASLGHTSNHGENSRKLLANAAEEGSGAVGYASDAAPHPSGGGSVVRKRGTPWTEEEHKLFLIGLVKVGKGDWRGISRKYVKTRTPTQIASHAQKYFLHLSKYGRRRRSSLFDITTDSVAAMPTAQPTSLPQPVPSNVNEFSIMPFPISAGPVQNFLANTSSSIHFSHVSVPPIPPPSAMVDLNLNQQAPLEPSPLSLRLSLSMGQNQSSTTDRDSSPPQVISSYRPMKNVKE